VEFTDKLNDDGGSLKQYNDCLCSKPTDCYGTRGKLNFSLGQYTTVFQAEMYTIRVCAVENLDRNNRNRNIYILSDSEAEIKTLDNYNTNSKLVWDCQQSLMQLANMTVVS
jgi:hypothetical protein